MKTLISAALAVLTVSPALADETTGHVLAFDRKDGVLVLTDKSVWTLGSGLTIPADLGAGDRVLITYETAGEDGLTQIDALLRTAIALPEGTDGGS